MKKRLLTTAVLVVLIGIFQSIYAAENINGQENVNIGDVTGTYKKSNAVVTIHVRDYEERTIPTYVVGDDICICVEDLEFYGYKRTWDGKNRITSLVSSDIKRTGTVRCIGKSGNTFYSDIQVYVDGIRLDGFNTGGYTLVKIRELDKVPGIYFWREYEQEGIETIDLKGKVKLPEGEVAPKGGIHGQVIEYGMSTTVNKGFPEKIYSQPFEIKEGQNSCAYELEGLMDYQYVGYEIDPAYGYSSGSLFDDKGRPIDDYGIFVKDIEPFKDDYGRFDIDILKKSVKIKGAIELQNMRDEEYWDTREIRLLAIDRKYADRPLWGSKFKENILSMPAYERTASFEMDVIPGRDYVLRVDVSDHVTFKNIHGMQHRPQASFLATGYYSSEGLVKDSGQAAIIHPLESGIEGISITARIDDEVKYGRGAKSAARTYLSGDEILSVTVNGDVYIFVGEFDGRGFSMLYDENSNIHIIRDADGSDGFEKGQIQADDLEKKREYLLTHGIFSASDIKVYIASREIDNYNMAYSYVGPDIVVKVEDLKDYGFDIIQNGYTIEMSFPKDNGSDLNEQ